MVLSKFYRQSSRNVSGNQYLFLAEADNIYDVTVTGGEVSQLIMKLDYKFEGIEADHHSVKRQQKGTNTKKRFMFFEHTIGFRVAQARTAVNDLSGELENLLPKGVAAITMDANGQCWLTGWSQREEIARPLYLESDNFDSGENANELATGKNTYLLKADNDEKDLPLDATLNSYVQTQINNAMGLGLGIGLGFTRGGGGVSLDIAYTSTQFVFKFKLPSTKEVTIDWGDGNTEDVTGQDATIITKISNYSGAGNYTFALSGDADELTFIDISSQTFVSGDISGWSTLTELTTLYCYSTSVTGDISGWSALTKLVQLWFNNTSLTGDIASLSTLTSATTFVGRVTDISGDISSLSVLTGLTGVFFRNTDVTFDNTPAWTNASCTINLYSINDTGATSTMVDNMIASLSTCTNCTINISGNNAHRTAASNDDLNTLYANGNIITLNDILGDELHTDLNAANDSATEAITAFADHAATIDGATKVTIGEDITDMLPKGAEEVTNGDFANWTEPGAPGDYPTNWILSGNNATNYFSNVGGAVSVTRVDNVGLRIWQPSVFTVGKYYVITGDITGLSAGYFRLNAGSNIDILTNGSFTEITRATSTSFNIWAQYADNGATIDNVSVKEIEVLGSDVVTNGDFANWTGDNPDNWAVTESGGNIITENPANEAQFISDGTLIRMLQSMLTVGEAYLITVVCSAHTSGSIYVYDAGFGITGPIIDGIGTYVFTGIAGATGLYIGRNGTGINVTISSISVHKLLVTKEIAASTNYTGDQYVLPVDVNNFAIPVDYTAEAIVAQKITGETDAVTGWTAVGLGDGETKNVSNCENAPTTPYDTFANATPTGFDAICLTSGTFRAGTADEIPIVSGRAYLIEFDFVLNSGQKPGIVLRESIEGTLLSTVTNIATGANSIVLTATGSATGVLGFSSSLAGDFEITNLSVKEANVFESQSSVVNEGNFALHADANDIPTGGAGFNKDFTVDSGAVYRLSWDWNKMSGDRWAMKKGSSILLLDDYNLGWKSEVYYLTTSSTSHNVNFAEASGNNNGEYAFDNISMKKVTFP